MTLKPAAVVLALALVATLAFGYGGIEAGVSFVGTDSLNAVLTRMSDSVFGGASSGEFTYRAPMWWVGGHGGNRVGMLTFGGSGAASVWQSNADSMGSEMAAVRGEFEVGYPYSPAEYFWVRPYLDVCLASWFIYCHSVENGVVIGGFDANITRWYTAWAIGAVPGVEVMGRVRTGATSSVGLFAKAGYFIPISGYEWYGDENLQFGLRGFTLTAGLRFGQLPIRPYRI